jgi:hypothetical protein
LYVAQQLFILALLLAKLLFQQVLPLHITAAWFWLHGMQANTRIEPAGSTARAYGYRFSAAAFVCGSGAAREGTTKEHQAVFTLKEHQAVFTLKQHTLKTAKLP